MLLPLLSPPGDAQRHTKPDNPSGRAGAGFRDLGFKSTRSTAWNILGRVVKLSGI